MNEVFHATLYVGFGFLIYLQCAKSLREYRRAREQREYDRSYLEMMEEINQIDQNVQAIRQQINTQDAELKELPSDQRS